MANNTIDTAQPSVKYVSVGQDGTLRTLTANGQPPSSDQINGVEAMAKSQGRGVYIAKLTVASGGVTLEKHAVAGDPTYPFDEALGNFTRRQNPSQRGNSYRLNVGA